jgi:hypothetical protein
MKDLKIYIKRFLLSEPLLWKEIDHTKERHEYDGYFPESWTYQHRIFKRTSFLRRFKQDTKKLEMIQALLDVYDKSVSKS